MSGLSDQTRTNLRRLVLSALYEDPQVGYEEDCDRILRVIGFDQAREGSLVTDASDSPFWAVYPADPELKGYQRVLVVPLPTSDKT